MIQHKGMSAGKLHALEKKKKWGAIMKLYSTNGLLKLLLGRGAPTPQHSQNK